MDIKDLKIQDGMMIRFMLVVDPKSGIPGWIAEMDELTLHLLARAMYDFINKNLFMCTKYNMNNKDDFAATIPEPYFRTYDMRNFGYLGKFRDILTDLLNRMRQNYGGMNPPKMYVAINSTSSTSDHVVHAFVEGNANTIVLGANIDPNKEQEILIANYKK